MRIFRGLGLGIILAVVMTLISCEKPSLNEDINRSSGVKHKADMFEISGDDLLKITILEDTASDKETQEIIGVMDQPEDIKELADIINKSPLMIGDATADFYRILEITNKDGSRISLEFGGNGRFFKNRESELFYQLDPETKYEALHQIIERVERNNLDK